MGTRFESPNESNVLLFLTAKGTRISFQEGEAIFTQGDAADCVFYIEHGIIKKSYVASSGKERVIAICKAREFLGIACVAGQRDRRHTATAMNGCSLVRVEKSVMLRMIAEQPGLADLLISFLIDRNNHYQEHVREHLFYPSEKRLARTLLDLCEIGTDGKDEVPKISQETLAEIVGTTRSRVNYFMNKFRDNGFVEYGDKIRVQRSKLQGVLDDSLTER